jgi:hypothetical protein
VTGGLVAFVLAFPLCGAPSASAGTNGFWIYNLTSGPLKLVDVQWHGFPDNGRGHPEPPEIGDVLAPGLPPLHIEIFNQGRETESYVTLKFRTMGATDPQHTVTLRLVDHDSSGDEKATCEEDPASLLCQQVHKPFFGKIAIVEPKSPERTVGADNPQKQAELLRSICTRASLEGESTEDAFVECDFSPQPIEMFGPAHPVGAPQANCAASGDATARIGYADKVVITDSLGIPRGSGTEGIFERAKAGAKYANAQSWLEEHQFRYAPEIKIPAGHLGWVVASNPIIRHQGDFKLRIGNTSWLLRGVYFDTPYPRSGSTLRRPRFDTKTEPLTAEQRAKLCKGSAGLVRAPVGWATGD